jgi:hypothetical protein
MKARCCIILVALGIASQVSAQSAERSFTTITEFGEQLYKGLSNKNISLLFPLLYTRTGLMETFRTNVGNEELRSQMLADIEHIPDFDEKIAEECQWRYDKLIATIGIEWDKIKYENFEFRMDTLQSMRYQTEVGSGYLYFSYKSDIYQIKVDKMAKLVSGWRGHEFSTACLKTEKIVSDNK